MRVEVTCELVTEINRTGICAGAGYTNDDVFVLHFSSPIFINADPAYV